MIRIGICDDEVKELDLLEEKLKNFSAESDAQIIIERFNSGFELLNIYENNDDFPEIIYLDIHMPGINGMEVADRLRKEGYIGEIIFYTRSSPEVFESFYVDAFHYIVKGKTKIDDEKRIFDYAYNDILKQREDFISLSCGGELVTIPIKQIKYFEVNNKVVTVYYDNKKKFEFYTSLSKLAHVLISREFIRINGSCLVNMRYIRKQSNTEITLADGIKVEIGRTYRKKAKIILSKYFKSKEVLRL
ncbi:MAG: LytTR family DNA-binding domain-containing protein [Lachnospiraceae bacterium]|nr:LytTR family DNA-binding domain-containing protein [Lachnospiraceae bacterium]